MSLLIASPAASEGFLRIVAGESWGYFSRPILEDFLDRTLVNDTIPGLRAATVAADPSLFSTPQPGDMIWLSLGGLDVLDGTPQATRQANLLTIINRYMEVPWTRVIHVGYNDTLPDVTPDTRAMLTALWPGRYIWVDLRHLDIEPLVWAQEGDPLHLYFVGYQLRVGAVLSFVTRLGWHP